MKYQVIFDVNGGTGTIARQIKTHGTDLTLTTQKPSKSGYEFIGWGTSKDDKTVDYEVGGTYKEEKTIRLYAIYKKTITGTFNYYDGSKAAKTTSSATRYMNYEGTYTQNNISIPEEVTGSKGPANTTYSHVSTTKTGEGETPNTELGVINYYTVYKKTVTATMYTYNNQKTTKTGTAYGYYDGTTANASINFGTTSLSGYTARGWSTAKEGNANINVALNGTASILNDTTYYMSYTYTVTATLYTYNNTSSTKTGTAYMNYVGTKIGAKPTTPSVKNPSGWTGRGWSTSSSATGTITTPGTITGNATYYYSWSRTVTLTYSANGGSGAPSAASKTAYLNYAGTPTNASFTVSSTTPTRTGWTFQGWSTSSTATSASYKGGSTIGLSANDTLYAIFIDNIIPVMGTLTVSTTNWTNQNVTLTGKARDIGSGISYYQFSTNPNVTDSSTEWKKITNTTSETTQTFSASSNDTYYFHVKDKAGNINKKSIVVNKIDKTAPSISTFTIQNTTTTSIKVNISASDSQSGIATYKYYLNGTLKFTSTTNSYTFTGLTEGTSYTLKVVVTDNARNSSEKSLTGKTDYPTITEKLKEGDYVYYIDKTGIQRKCIVLYDENSPYKEIQIITADSVEDVKIGNVNSYETTKSDYNNAISNLNIRANAYLNTTYASSARCVGSVPNSPNSESGLYNRSETWFTKWRNTFKDDDENYIYDWNQMNHLNIHDINKIYWLASRLIYTKEYYSSFDVRIVYTHATLNDYGFIATHSDGKYYLVENTAGLRPVFTLKDTVKVTGGNGTKNSPYILGI